MVVLAVIMAVIVDAGLTLCGDDTDVGNGNDCGGDIGVVLGGSVASSAS